MPSPYGNFYNPYNQNNNYNNNGFNNQRQQNQGMPSQNRNYYRGGVQQNYNNQRGFNQHPNFNQAARFGQQPNFNQPTGFNQPQFMNPNFQNNNQNHMNNGMSMHNMPQNANNIPPIVPGGLQNPFSQPLPDGITIQPLNEETLKEIHGISPDLSNISPPLINNENTFELNQLKEIPEQITPKIERRSINDRLADIIQNEKNGANYYKRLAEIAPKSEYKSLLNKISDYCDLSRNNINSVYKRYKGEYFEPKEADLKYHTKFRDGVFFAILEESRNIRELSEFFEETEDSFISKHLLCHLYRKTSDLNILQAILSK